MPPPVYALAIATEDRKDDVKLSGALQKLAEENPSLQVVHDAETGETILRGQGEMHLHAAIERLAKSSGLKVSTAKPRVPYKETIRRAVQQHARLKRQTGGHGQFADVKLDIAPRARGEGFAFNDKIVGGAVPRQYIPAVGEAAEAAARKGPFGHPVVDVAVTLVDGTFHSVDSSDMAFKTATRMAMQEGLAKADPVMLEPIDHVTISVPNEYTPSAQRLLTGRRGRILGYAERRGLARLGRCGGAGAGGRAARPHHRAALAHHGARHVSARVRPSRGGEGEDCGNGGRELNVRGGAAPDAAPRRRWRRGWRCGRRGRGGVG